jgi:cation:H+ antiporter
MSKVKAAVYVVVGLAILLAGAELLVTGAESMARRFGISELVIGLTIVAIGTSLPELAVTVVSALRGDSDIAVGNVIGSNIFNLLAVIGFAGAVGPAALDPSVLLIHCPIMLAFTLIPLRLAYNPFGKPGLGRGTGLALVVAFLAYQALLLSGRL